MHKSSKRQRGPVTEDSPEASTIETTEMLEEELTLTKMSESHRKALGKKAVLLPLEPEERGMQVFVTALKHNKSFRKLADLQYAAGEVSMPGSVKLPDGQEIKIGATLKTAVSPALNALIRGGVLLAGKAPRRS